MDKFVRCLLCGLSGYSRQPYCKKWPDVSATLEWIIPDNATNKKIRWSSSKESVATVTPEGIVEAVSAGTSFVTATSEDSGVNAKCEITVKEKAIKAGTANITATTVDQGKSASCAVTVAARMGAVTGEATHISCRNAKLSGKAIMPLTTTTSLRFGVLYSTSSGVLYGSATQLEANAFDTDSRC